MKPSDLNDLFIYDLANNHQGDIEHAKAIIQEVGRVNAEAGVRGALKFQFRQLDTFIHPDYQDRTDIKFIKRFSETRLPMEVYHDFAKVAREAGLYAMCTPFDEASVDVICDMGLDIIKVASCSANDRPLLKKIASVNIPVIASTAGLRLDEIDWLVNFLESERVDFALMHCVAQYPTPNHLLQLNQIDLLRDRYRGIPIGWSTHEDQDNTSAIQIAVAKGARLFERHVGIPKPGAPLNAYSSTPEQLTRWLGAYRAAKEMVGAPGRPPASAAETATLLELKRGIYVKRDVTKGEILSDADVFFAMPVQEGQLTSEYWRAGLVADRDYSLNEALAKELAEHDETDEEYIYQIMLQVQGLLNIANVRINSDAEIEISHHYGLRRFREFGAVIITCINRSYAKKLVIQLPRQKHPYHFHKRKEETFQLLHGDMEIVKYNDDSFYQDPKISELSRDDRKTKVDQWREYFRAKHAL
jgi:N-acetylneuraminate synthase